MCWLILSLVLLFSNINDQVWLCHESVDLIKTFTRLLWHIMNLSILWICLSEIHSISSLFLMDLSNVNIELKVQGFVCVIVLRHLRLGLPSDFILLLCFVIIVSMCLCLYSFMTFQVGTSFRLHVPFSWDCRQGITHSSSSKMEIT